MNIFGLPVGEGLFFRAEGYLYSFKNTKTLRPGGLPHMLNVQPSG